MASPPSALEEEVECEPNCVVQDREAALARSFGGRENNTTTDCIERRNRHQALDAQECGCLGPARQFSTRPLENQATLALVVCEWALRRG